MCCVQPDVAQVKQAVDALEAAEFEAPSSTDVYIGSQSFI
jgi:hypothetical protein